MANHINGKYSKAINSTHNCNGGGGGVTELFTPYINKAKA